VWSAAKAQTSTGRIRGRVIAAATGTPVQGATVRAARLGAPGIQRETRTDENGRYALADLPAGTYSFFVIHPAYLEQNFDQPQPLARYRMLELADGEQLVDVDFRLHRGGVITGVITDENGEPVPGVRVAALREMVSAIGRNFIPVRADFTIPTDDRGRFRIYGLQPGAYLVLATAPRTSDGSLAIGRTYYPGTTNINDAQIVRLTLTQEAFADFSILPAKHARISGIARDSHGRPATDAHVALITPRGIQFDTIGTSGIDVEGNFSLGNIPPGDHVLHVRPGGGAFEWAVMPVTVAGTDITDLVVTTGPGFTISGRVTFDNSSARPALKGLKVATNLADRSIRWMMPAPPRDNGVVDDEGQFTISYVAGRMWIVPGSALPSGWFFKRVLLKGVDVTLSGIDVTSKIEGLEFVVTDRATIVSGTVRNTRGTGVTDYIVAFFPVGQFDERDRGRRQRTIRPNPDGVYRIRNLPEGDYVAAAVPVLSLPIGAEWDPAFLEKVRPAAIGFKLAEGQSLPLNLTLTE
jgi:hypothetical protein